MARALSLTARHLRLDQVCFFSWNPDESALSLEFAWTGNACVEAEEQIAVPESSALRPLVDESRICASPGLAYPAIYVPVCWGGFRGAALRLERFRKASPFSEAGRELAKGLADELGQNLYHADINQRNKEQLKRANALTELTAVFASSMRVRDGLRLILQGIQRYFGFDRVRLYLADLQAQKLTGELSADIRGQARSLSHEVIPLQPGAHRFADIILGTGGETRGDRFMESVVYLPLTVQGNPTGLLIVDNLLSQQPVLSEDLITLKSFAGQIALAVDNARLFDRVQELSLYDELTRLPVRRYFMERFQEETYRAERFGQALALIWIDVDYFKEVNDTYGHQIGDQVLKEAGRVILRNLRKIDFPCRYGGDEILILLPQARPEEAKAIAARLSREMGEIRVPVPFSKVSELRVGISQGIAVFPGDAASMDELLQKADEALYWVKSHGRGGIALYGEVLGNQKDGRQKSEDGSQKTENRSRKTEDGIQNSEFRSQNNG